MSDKAITVEVGPFFIRLNGPAHFLDALKPWLRSFMCRRKARVHGVGYLKAADGPFVTEDMPLDFRWRSSGTERDDCLTFSYVRGRVLDASASEVALEVDPRALRGPTPQVILWLNQWILRMAWTNGGGAVHAAGLVPHRNAVLAVGASGAGKTTLSRMARKAGWTVLDDEIVLVMPDPKRDGHALAGRLLPRTVDDGRPCGMFPVRLVAFIGHGERLSVSEPPVRDWLPDLMAQWFVVEGYPAAWACILDNILHCFDNTPIIKVHYPIKDEILEFLYRKVEGRPGTDR